ncbi:UTRA domain-containing protein [Streptomyces abikoensis]|uniref:UTRA domain-containing protein n=1 Tax=Streptomyces abikoensis TaxID=97398 RepID=UPI003715B0B9
MTGQRWTSQSINYLTPRSSESSDAWAEEASQKGSKGTQSILFVGEVVPPRIVAAELDLEPGGVAVVRQRAMYLDGHPVELTDSYYPVGIARGTRLAEARKIPGGAVTLLAQLGKAVAHVSESVNVDLPGPEIERALQLTSGEPVLVLTRTSHSREGEPVEVSVMTMTRGTRLGYEMKVG